LQQLDRIFERQHALQSRAEGAAPRAFVLLTVADVRLVVPLERLREVVEATPVTPYPIPEPGHVGIANLRGNLLPVVTPGHLDPTLSALSSRRESSWSPRLLVVFETSDGALIGLGVDGVRKIMVPPEDLPKGDGSEYVVAVRGEPVRLLSVDLASPPGRAS
jgi:chemotaxis signal transduction protein